MGNFEGGREIEYILLPRAPTLDMKALADMSFCSSLWVVGCNNSSQCCGAAGAITTNFLYFPNLWMEVKPSTFIISVVVAELNITGHHPYLVFPQLFQIFVSAQFPVLNLFLLKIPRAISFSLCECSLIGFPIFSVNNTNIYPLAKNKNIGVILDSLFFSLLLVFHPTKSQPGYSSKIYAESHSLTPRGFSSQV